MTHQEEDVLVRRYTEELAEKRALIPLQTERIYVQLLGQDIKCLMTKIILVQRHCTKK